MIFGFSSFPSDRLLIFKKIQKFIEGGKNGVILFSFGSIIKASTLPRETIAIFMDVFSRLPLRVIWKFEGEMKNVSSNVMLLKWLPQRDILGKSIKSSKSILRWNFFDANFVLLVVFNDFLHE